MLTELAKQQRRSATVPLRTVELEKQKPFWPRLMIGAVFVAIIFFGLFQFWPMLPKF
jgi:hypothetical protein